MYRTEKDKKIKSLRNKFREYMNKWRAARSWKEQHEISVEYGMDNNYEFNKGSKACIASTDWNSKGAKSRAKKRKSCERHHERFLAKEAIKEELSEEGEKDENGGKPI